MSAAIVSKCLFALEDHTKSIAASDANEGEREVWAKKWCSILGRYREASAKASKDADVEAKVEALVATARTAYADVENPEWSSWAKELLSHVPAPKTIDLVAELAALESKYQADVKELDDLFFSEDGGLSEEEYAAKMAELEGEWEKDKEDIRAKATASAKGKARARSVSVVAADEGNGERENSPVARKDQTPTTDGPVDTKKLGPCDLCRKRKVECRFDANELNCQLCTPKKQACRWNGLNRHGKAPQQRKKKGRDEKVGIEAPTVLLSPAVGGKRKRSRAIVLDSEGEEEVNAGGREDKEDEAQVEDSIRPAKKKRVYVGKPPPLGSEMWEAEGSKSIGTPANEKREDAFFDDSANVNDRQARFAALTLEVKISMARKTILEEHIDTMVAELQGLMDS